MLLYLLLCVISVFAGCGILSLIGLDVDRPPTLFLTPVVTLCALALLMGCLVAGGFTVGEITPAAYVLVCGAATLGAIRHRRIILASWRSLLVLAALPLLILLPSIIDGIENYSGGLCMDGWSYVTFGQSLQHYALGSDGWFPVSVQYSAAFGRATRFISCAFLALLAPLSGEHNDTQEVLGHYLGWLFFTYASACIFFAKTTRLRRSMAWTFVFIATLSGWILKVINANSVDNALALCLLPAALGVLGLAATLSVRHGIVLGAILATVLYAYPESAPFAFGAFLAMTTQKVIAAPNRLREFGRVGVSILVTLVVLVWPYGPEIASFFRHEATLAASPVGIRPGEGFYHSLSARGYTLPGYWGLTPDFDGRLLGDTYLHHYNRYALTLAGILSAGMILGVFQLLRRREWSLPLFVTGMTAAYTVLLVQFRYSYAAYKVLVLTWPFVVYTISVAAEWIQEELRRRSWAWTRYAAGAAGLGIVAAILATFFLQERIFYDTLPFKSVREFKKISVASNLAGESGIALIVNDTHANIWALHFLRSAKLYLAGQYRGYMVGYASILNRSEPVDPSEIRIVISDSNRSMESKRLISRIGPYYIWDGRHGPWIALTEVSNPNGVEGGPTEPFVWMGNGDTELRILASAATSAVVRAHFTLGPGLPGKTRQRLLVKLGQFEEKLAIVNGEQSFAVPLQAGLNHVILRPLERVTTFLPTDPRQLLIHMTGISVSTPHEEEAAQIQKIENPNGLESRSGKEQFFWINGADTALSISASTAGVARLSATLLPGPSLVDKSCARLHIFGPLGVTTEQNLNWGPAQIDIPVQAGLNRILIRAAGPSGRNGTASRNARVMMIGFRNLRASFLDEVLQNK